MRRVMAGFVLAAVIGVVACGGRAWAEPPKEGPKPLRVGTYDSRAVAVAFAPSEVHETYLKALMKEHAEAKAAGDEEKVKRLEAEGQAGQDLMHQQGFGTAPVDNILKHMEDQLPAIAREAGVDVIVSKWQITWQAPGVETVDVTDLMVKPFKPTERTLKTIAELRRHAPIPNEKLKNLKD